jgi:hypothetical protein
MQLSENTENTPSQLADLLVRLPVAIKRHFVVYAAFYQPAAIKRACSPLHTQISGLS